MPDKAWLMSTCTQRRTVTKVGQGIVDHTDLRLLHLNEECPLDEDGREAYVAQVTSFVVSIIRVVVSFRD